MKHEHTKNVFRWKRYLALTFVALASMAFTQPELDEYEVKAMFLINFVKYVDWAPENPGTMRIGVAGKSDILPVLERIAANRKGGARPLEIVQVNASQPPHCHLLFIPSHETRKAASFSRELAGKGVLIVTEDNLSNTRVGGINLIRADNRIKFEINQAAIKQAGIRLSGQLQQLATTLNP